MGFAAESQVRTRLSAGGKWTDAVAQRERQQDADRPWPSSTDELHQRDDAAADAPRRVFGGVGKA
jgi:hypothetical protein